MRAPRSKDHGCFVCRFLTLGKAWPLHSDPDPEKADPTRDPTLERNPMPSKRFIASAVASIGLFAPLTQPIRALAQSPDVRQEDTREDRREDRREDQREELQINVPRTAAGAIDAQKLVAEIRAFFDHGVREVRIRERGLTAQERTQIAQLVQQVAADFRLERVRLRQDDDRLRVELRAEREVHADRREDRREERREDRVERRENRPERLARVERPERAERAERPERAERAERPERVERPDHSGRH
jgi:hypothetical protein